VLHPSPLLSPSCSSVHRSPASPRRPKRNPLRPHRLPKTSFGRQRALQGQSSSRQDILLPVIVFLRSSSAYLSRHARLPNNAIVASRRPGTLPLVAHQIMIAYQHIIVIIIRHLLSHSQFPISHLSYTHPHTTAVPFPTLYNSSFSPRISP